MPTSPRQGLEEPVAGSASREIGPHVEINLPEPHRQVLEQIEAGPLPPPQVRSALLDDAFAAARRGEVVEAAKLLGKWCGGDFVALAICSAAAEARVRLDRAADLNSFEAELARDLLVQAFRAAGLRHAGAWPELASALVDMAGIEGILEMEDHAREREAFEPAVRYAERSRVVQRSASEQAARRRHPEQQHRAACFAAAMRADPDGGPQRWAATVAPLAFGSEVRHVENAARWLRRHRGKVEAARTNSDSPANCPAVVRSE